MRTSAIALATVFSLNALALILFPLIGHHLQLTQEEFGYWAALSIHDTSSVVGASLQYGSEALGIATTLKLTRALWIIPLTIILGLRRKEHGSTKKPWFIVGFLMTSALVTLVPGLEQMGRIVASGAKGLLVPTLFLIGWNLSRDVLRQMGLKPFFHGVVLWLLTASGSLLAIRAGWIP